MLTSTLLIVVVALCATGGVVARLLLARVTRFPGVDAGTLAVLLGLGILGATWRLFSSQADMTLVSESVRAVAIARATSSALVPLAVACFAAAFLVPLQSMAASVGMRAVDVVRVPRATPWLTTWIVAALLLVAGSGASFVVTFCDAVAGHDVGQLFDDLTGPVAKSGWFLLCAWLGGAVTMLLGVVLIALGVNAGVRGLEQVGSEDWFTAS